MGILCVCCSSDNSLSKCKIALFTLFAGKWGIRKEGNITVATKERRICNEVFCLDLIMHCYVTVFLAEIYKHPTHIRNTDLVMRLIVFTF